MKFSKQKSDEIHNDITESISRETTEEASRVIIEDDYKKSRRHSKKKNAEYIQNRQFMFWKC